MIWIGIDPSTVATGIVAVNHEGQLEFRQLIEKDPKIEKDPTRRSWEIACEFRLIKTGQVVAAIGIEWPIYIQNARTTIVLSALWGMLCAAAKKHTGLVYEVSIGDAKYALTGNRKATKAQMVQAAKLQFGVKMCEHNADALGCALATRARYMEEDLWDRALLQQ